ncbi:ATP-dependent endonuclease [Polynucleobacter sp. P1-05-14]|uniref:ATP-dependent nuclease n=1 Tax=Polynucleobacter sp. P1-05-14 TaxID=1819732 RepID=UPI001C0A99BB|nr:AAA family ATPase [Polynucleobacter sp. P1-05-14]MBU3548093.1 AAA family ATPase [Polynucleobacter sp. P1-05-14]
MSYYAQSEIAVTDVRVHNFRSLVNVEVALNDLTVLIGANNAGKTSFLDATFAAIGSGRRALGQDDIRIAVGEAFAPKDRKVIIDLRIRPIDSTGKILDKFPVGSFWTALWGTEIAIDAVDFYEFAPIRTQLFWSPSKAEYIVERNFLKEWRAFKDWVDTPLQNNSVRATQLEPIALHLIDAKRDLDDDLRRQGSFWRRLTDDLGLEDSDISDIEAALSNINQELVNKSPVLLHLRENLSDLQNVVSADSSAIDISPVARKLRDLSKGVDISFSTTGAQSFPLSRHGMGTRSLASLLVFKAFASWRHAQATKGGDKVHTILALEEPESHLHPQAQRSLFKHIKGIAGQRIVSTHSPYFAGQAQLEDLRLFIKKGGDTVVSKLDLTQLEKIDDKRKLEECVIESRGDILFAQALVLFEGQTEEQALPIWAQEYWGASIHELGFSFARVNGTDYFPFIWLAQSLEIPWYLIADGEPQPLQSLEKALKKANLPESAKSSNIVVLPSGNNFESQLVFEGYMPEIEAAFESVSGKKGFLDGYIADNDGLSYGPNKGVRDYKSAGGRERAAIDAMKKQKTKLAKPLAHQIIGISDPARRFPSTIDNLFRIISANHSIPKS